MKKYNITVNGKTYDVEVEEVGGDQPSITVAPAPAGPAPKAPDAAPETKAAAPAPPAAPASAAAPSAPSAGATVIEAPMPGTILDVLVKAGDAVAADQVLLILEAMKMENEIVAPAAGTVDTVAVAKGASVGAGDVLVSIK
ncbi:MAG: biotin/lipoyl-binding protein [Clostridiales Family XIII bacterium]|nr:biotin/lipoyl-binding protein [Clostridiales Family XIII bacterium]